MPVITAPYDYLPDDLYVDLTPQVGRALYLKCEGFNFAGSIKLKAAREIMSRLEASGAITRDSILIESSSGNMGIAISMIAASKGLRFICVTDRRCNPVSKRIIEAFGAEVLMIERPDPLDGFLGARLRYIREICASDSRYVWLNQYTNPGNWGSHVLLTAPAIDRRFPRLHALFVGAGTTGTLMGCARYFRGRQNQPRIVAVDSVGSVTFGGPPGQRWIPGLGSSVPPPHLDRRFVDDVIMVEEADTIRTCRELAARGFLFGGSTGTVVAGATAWLSHHDPAGQLTAVALAPDLGERYLESIYDDAWTERTFPAAGLTGPGAGSHTLTAAVER